MAYVVTAVLALLTVLSGNWLDMKLKFADDERTHKKTLKLYLVRLALGIGYSVAAYSFVSTAISKEPLTRLAVASMVINGWLLPLGVTTYITGKLVEFSTASTLVAQKTTEALAALTLGKNKDV